MTEGGPRWSRALPYLPALVAYAWLAWKLDFLCDDAFISFRYSANLAAGEGLRYNLTLGAPVEGYSNFLWVLWLALFERLDVDVTVAARLTSTVLGAVLVTWVSWRARRALRLDAVATAATGLFLGTLPPVALWATGGLATMPAALCVWGVYDRLLGDPRRPRGWQAGVFAALAALVRADGAVWALMLLGAGGLVWLLGGRRRDLFRALLQASLVLVVVVGAHVAWRYGYYGDYLPNTARIKAGFSWHRLARGLDYVVAWALNLPAVLLLAVASLRRWRREELHLWLPAAVVLIGTLGYGVWVGGDFMPMGRFLFSAVPFLALLFAAAWSRFVAPAGRTRPGFALAGLACVLLGACACYDVNLVPATLRARFHFRQDREWESELSMRAGMDQRAREWSIQGRALGRVTRPRETYVAGAMGAVGYYSELEIFDTYGLVTPSVREGARPIERSSPGHDMRVQTTFFQPRHPTYAGSILAPVSSPLGHGLPAGWERHPLSRMVTLERHPLLPEDGAPEGWELRLLRYQRWE